MNALSLKMETLHRLTPLETPGPEILPGIRLTIPLPLFHDSSAMSAQLQSVYSRTFGKRPMEDPFLENIFLTCMEGLLPYSPEEIEAAFYQA